MVLRIAFDWNFTPIFSGFIFAKEFDFFGKEGLNSDQIEFLFPKDYILENVSETTPPKLLENGDVDFCIMSPDDLLHYYCSDDKPDLISIASIFKKDESAIFVWRESGIKRPADLVGKKYASYGGHYELNFIKELIRNDLKNTRDLTKEEEDTKSDKLFHSNRPPGTQSWDLFLNEDWAVWGYLPFQGPLINNLNKMKEKMHSRMLKSTGIQEENEQDLRKIYDESREQLPFDEDIIPFEEWKEKRKFDKMRENEILNPSRTHQVDCFKLSSYSIPYMSSPLLVTKKDFVLDSNKALEIRRFTKAIARGYQQMKLVSTEDALRIFSKHIQDLDSNVLDLKNVSKGQFYSRFPELNKIDYHNFCRDVMKDSYEECKKCFSPSSNTLTGVITENEIAWGRQSKQSWVDFTNFMCERKILHYGEKIIKNTEIDVSSLFTNSFLQDISTATVRQV